MFHIPNNIFDEDSFCTNRQDQIERESQEEDDEAGEGEVGGWGEGVSGHSRSLIYRTSSSSVRSEYASSFAACSIKAARACSMPEACCLQTGHKISRSSLRCRACHHLVNHKNIGHLLRIVGRESAGDTEAGFGEDVENFCGALGVQSTRHVVLSRIVYGTVGHDKHTDEPTTSAVVAVLGILSSW